MFTEPYTWICKARNVTFYSPQHFSICFISFLKSSKTSQILRLNLLSISGLGFVDIFKHNGRKTHQRLWCIERSNDRDSLVGSALVHSRHNGRPSCLQNPVQWARPKPLPNSKRVSPQLRLDVEFWSGLEVNWKKNGNIFRGRDSPIGPKFPAILTSLKRKLSAFCRVHCDRRLYAFQKC